MNDTNAAARHSALRRLALALTGGLIAFYCLTVLPPASYAVRETGTVKRIKAKAGELRDLAEGRRPAQETADDADAKPRTRAVSENAPAQTEWNSRLFLDWLMRILRALIMILVGWILYRFLTAGIKRLETVICQKDAITESATVHRLRTLSGLIYWFGTIAIGIVVIYIVLENFGFNVAPILAGAGIVGLAFGFGGQYLIRDVINGIFILLEGQYDVNDVIKVGDGLSGLVEKVNLRVTQLRDLEGRVIYVPNGEIKSVINFTKEWSRALFEVGIAYKENVDRVIGVIKDLGKEMRKDPHFGRLILEDLEMLGVDGFGDSSVNLKFFIKTLPIRQWEVAREFRRRLKNRFDELNIEIPFPHRTIYWGTGADNEWMRHFFKSGTAEEWIRGRPAPDRPSGEPPAPERETKHPKDGGIGDLL